MDNIILLIVCLILGLFLRRVKVFPDNAHVTLNHFIIYVCLPALSLLYIPQVEINSQILFPVGVAYIIYFFGFIFISLAGKLLKFSRASIGALILTCGFANTSFVGFPFLKMLFGEQSLKTGIVIDQTGSFIAITTLGIITASYYSATVPSAKLIVKNILQFPPLYSFVVGLIMNLSGISFPEMVNDILDKLGSPIYILALISVGMQLSFNFKGIRFSEISTGIFYKLILAPFIIYLLYVVILKGSGEVVQVSVIESAMGPMVTGAILATNYNLNPKLVALVTGLGIILSFGTVMLWYTIVKGI